MYGNRQHLFKLLSHLEKQCCRKGKENKKKGGKQEDKQPNNSTKTSEELGQRKRTHPVKQNSRIPCIDPHEAKALEQRTDSGAAKREKKETQQSGSSSIGCGLFSSTLLSILAQMPFQSVLVTLSSSLKSSNIKGLPV
jgi:hypothetical protein